jgi:hypothetical protein
MTNPPVSDPSSLDHPAPEKPEIVDADAEAPEPTGTVSEPAKVMRIGTMIRQLLEEVKATDLDEPGRDRLKEIYETSVEELAQALSPDLRSELERLALPFDGDEVPTGPELRIAQAQLVGWLEGLFHGIQATLFAQQTAARHQLEQMQRTQGLPPGSPQPGGQGGGVYL